MIIEQYYYFYDFSDISALLLKHAKKFLELDVPRKWKRKYFSLTLNITLKRSLLLNKPTIFTTDNDLLIHNSVDKPIFTIKNIHLIKNLKTKHIWNIGQALLAKKRVAMLKTSWPENVLDPEAYYVGQCKMKVIRYT